jgi:hypothetical protein
MPIYKYIRDHNHDWDAIRKVLVCEINLIGTDEDEQKRMLKSIEETYRKIKRPLCNACSAYGLDIERKKQYNKLYREEHKEKLKGKKKQYYEEHKEKLKGKKKQYYEDHKEQIQVKWGEKFVCECGGRYTHNHKSHHMKSKKHQQFIKSAH